MNRIALLGLAAAAIGCTGAKEDMVAAKLPPARDGNVAIQQEFCAARAKATREAWDLFIARHPRHKLADDARQERDRIGAKWRSTVRCEPPAAG